MTTQFTSVLHLPRLQGVLDYRESQINNLVNNLKIADVKEDVNFQMTKRRIKGQILMKPVVFADPMIADYQYTEREVSFMDQMNGMSRNVYTFSITVPFSGDSDLISHACTTPSFGSADRGIVSPDWGSSLSLYIDLSADEPEVAKQRAKEELRPTYENTAKNNLTVEDWNRRMDSRIESALSNRRIDLIQKYS